MSKAFRKLTGVILITCFMFSFRVLFGIYLDSAYDSTHWKKDLLFAITFSVVSIFIFPFFSRWRIDYFEKIKENKRKDGD